MSHTLKFEDESKSIPNPTEADIRSAVTSHVPDEDSFGPILGIGLDGTEEILRINSLEKGRFSFEYTDGNFGYTSKRQNFSPEETVKVLTAYGNGTSDWMKLVDWDKVKL